MIYGFITFDVPGIHYYFVVAKIGNSLKNLLTSSAQIVKENTSPLLRSSQNVRIFMVLIYFKI